MPALQQDVVGLNADGVARLHVVWQHEKPVRRAVECLRRIRRRFGDGLTFYAVDLVLVAPETQGPAQERGECARLAGSAIDPDRGDRFGERCRHRTKERRDGAESCRDRRGA